MTVVIPVRNGADYLAIAIESVLAQDVPGLRLIVSDNHSTDRTPEIASGATRDPRVEVVRPPAPLEMIAHFNRCLSLPQTTYYMLLCHDDYLIRPDALSLAVAALERHPDIAAAYCNLAYVDARGRRISERRFPRPAGPVDSGALAKQAVTSNRNAFGIPLLVRTAARGGLEYDPKLPYAGDLDLSIALSRGGSIYHLDQTLIANRFHGGNATVGLFRSARRQFDLIARKHGIVLGAMDRFRRAASVLATSIQKAAFFWWLALRSRAR